MEEKINKNKRMAAGAIMEIDHLYWKIEPVFNKIYGGCSQAVFEPEIWSY